MLYLILGESMIEVKDIKKKFIKDMPGKKQEEFYANKGINYN